jgi:hypothetical protein
VKEAEDDICTIMTVESGKPFAESKGEFTSGCAHALFTRSCSCCVPPVTERVSMRAPLTCSIIATQPPEPYRQSAADAPGPGHMLLLHAGVMIIFLELWRRSFGGLPARVMDPQRAQGRSQLVGAPGEHCVQNCDG